MSQGGFIYAIGVRRGARGSMSSGIGIFSSGDVGTVGDVARCAAARASQARLPQPPSLLDCKPEPLRHEWPVRFRPQDVEKFRPPAL
jgi:hypothetical protein